MNALGFDEALPTIGSAGLTAGLFQCPAFQ